MKTNEHNKEFSKESDIIIWNVLRKLAVTRKRKNCLLKTF